jgi:hypothetical protein
VDNDVRTFIAAMAVSLSASAAAAQTTIRVGDTVSGSLTPEDQVMEVDGSSFDCHLLMTDAGRHYSIELQSVEFDAFIGLGRGTACEPPVLLTNDDRAQGDTNSQLTFTSEGGDYFILANSYGPGETGEYRLTVTETSEAADVSHGPSLVRPSDPQDRYQFDLRCAAFAALGMNELMESDPSDSEIDGLQAANLALLGNAETSGAALGISAEAVGDEVIDVALDIKASEEMLEAYPPVIYRTLCLRAI